MEEDFGLEGGEFGFHERKLLFVPFADRMEGVDIELDLVVEEEGGKVEGVEGGGRRDGGRGGGIIELK